MNKIIGVVLLLIIAGCNSSKSSDVEVELGDNKQIDIEILTCNCDSLILSSDSLILQLNDVTFTGVCELNYPGTEQKYIDKQIVEGKIHGNVSYYSKFDDFLYSEVYNDGLLKSNNGQLKQCSCQELKIEKTDSVIKNYFKETLFTGKCEDYYLDTDQLYLEANYKNGLLSGYTIYYKKDGSTLFMQNYKEGILLDEIYPIDKKEDK